MLGLFRRRRALAVLAMPMGLSCPKPPADCWTTESKRAPEVSQRWEDWNEFAACLGYAMEDGCLAGEIREMPDGTTRFHCVRWLNAEAEAE